MKLSWVGMTATAIALGAGPVYAAGDTNKASGDKSQAADAKRAAALKASAWVALGKGDAVRAVQDAEAATMLLPGDAGMRALLGRAYLAAGRFQSAETAFADALALNPALPRAAVSRALAQIALGNPDAARASLASAEGIAPDADIGLAQALLGDTEMARQRLDAAAREPGADARTRQNLGLTYALEGRWSDAVAVAEQDVPADLMPQRLHRWAMIAQMKTDPAMQVGAILGVLPAADSGQPAALAMVAPPVAPAIIQTESTAMAKALVPLFEPVAARVAPVVHVENGAVVTAVNPKLPPLEELVVRAMVMPAIVLPDLAIPTPGPAMMVAEQVAVPTGDSPKPEAWAGPPRMRGATRRLNARPASAPISAPFAKHGLVAISAGTKVKPRMPAVILASQLSLKPASARSLGGWAVQLGAYSSHARREIAWGKLSARAGFLSAYAPTGAGHKLGKAMLYRLSVSGLATRKEAVTLCVRVRAAGGDCFVRNMRGDEPMRWALRPKAGERA